MEYRLTIVVTSVDDLTTKLAAYVGNQSLLESQQTIIKNLDNAALLLTVHASDIETALANSDSAMLAKLWVSGCNIDWRGFYAGGNVPTKTSLPTYPFAKERYWFTIPK